MRLLVQRVKNASVVVDDLIVGKIDNGLLVYVGFKNNDTKEILQSLAKKLVNLRVFEDNEGKLNLNVKDIDGKILSISQFTLYADCSHGNRPSFIEAMNAIDAKKMYEEFNEELKKYDIDVQEGIFQANMTVDYQNVGPVSIIIEKSL